MTDENRPENLFLRQSRSRFDPCRRLPERCKYPSSPDGSLRLNTRDDARVCPAQGIFWIFSKEWLIDDGADVGIQGGPASPILSAATASMKPWESVVCGRRRTVISRDKRRAFLTLEI